MNPILEHSRPTTSAPRVGVMHTPPVEQAMERNGAREEPFVEVHAQAGESAERGLSATLLKAADVCVSSASCASSLTFYNTASAFLCSASSFSGSAMFADCKKAVAFAAIHDTDYLTAAAIAHKAETLPF